MIPDDDYRAGVEAFRYWHNRALQYPSNYKMSFDASIASVNKKSSAFFEGLGLAIHAAEIPESRVKSVMEKVADQGQGLLPVKLNDFFNALKNDAVQIRFMDAVKATVAGSAADLATGFQEVGGSIVTTGKWVTTLMPVVLVGALLYIVAGRTRTLAGG